MIRAFALALLLAMAGCSCSGERPPPPPAPAPAAAPAPATTGTATSPPASESTRPAQSETEQATGSQESGDGDDQRQARSDTSLEQIAALPPGAQLPTGKWKPGVNYDPVVPAQPTSVAPGQVEVLEVFWLACPHCYALEPYIRSWLKSKPAYVVFVRVPVYWQPVHRAHARLYYTLVALGREDLVEKAFDTLHHDAEQHVAPMIGDSDEETFRLQQQFAVQNGVSADDFAKAYNSFSVSSNLTRADEITQRYRVQTVPLLIVNGKYVTDVARAGGETQLIQLINDLAAAEHGH